MRISITEVCKGDTIVDGRDVIKVDRIEHNACSSKGTHVNRRICYDRSERVQIRPGKHDESQSFEESGLGDLEGDEINPVLGLHNFNPGILV